MRWISQDHLFGDNRTVTNIVEKQARTPRSIESKIIQKVDRPSQYKMKRMRVSQRCHFDIEIL